MPTAELVERKRRDYPGCLLLWRVNETEYVALGDDAVAVAGACDDAASTRRPDGSREASISRGLLERDLVLLLRAGHKVVICEDG